MMTNGDYHRALLQLDTDLKQGLLVAGCSVRLWAKPNDETLELLMQKHGSWRSRELVDTVRALANQVDAFVEAKGQGFPAMSLSVALGEMVAAVHGLCDALRYDAAHDASTCHLLRDLLEVAELERSGAVEAAIQRAFLYSPLCIVTAGARVVAEGYERAVEATGGYGSRSGDEEQPQMAAQFDCIVISDESEVEECEPRAKRTRAE